MRFFSECVPQLSVWLGSELLLQHPVETIEVIRLLSNPQLLPFPILQYLLLGNMVELLYEATTRDLC